MKTILKPHDPKDRPGLDDRDASAPKEMPRGDELDEEIARLTDRLADLQRVFYADQRHALLIVFQGRDASGKDGLIRKVISAFNPQGVTVNNFKVPSSLEASHDFLWRIHQAVPARGSIGVFNRSQYEDIIAVRVHKLVPEPVWSRRYDEINNFEHSLSQEGVVIVKFMLHISRDEQRQRLLDRIVDPSKNWKFRAGDLDDRALWDNFTEAYEDVLKHCSTEHAPWYIVPSNKKKARDLLVAQVLVDTLEGLGLEYPKSDTDLSEFAAVLEGEAKE